MARPLKKGLDYFLFDINFFDDEKTRAIAEEYGSKGELAMIKLLCAVYRDNGYFALWNETLKQELLQQLPGVSSELLDQMINRLVKCDFFDEEVFNSVKILTSRGIQRRYQTICNKTHRKCQITQYGLLDKPRRQSAPLPKPKKQPKEVASVTKPDAEPILATPPVAADTTPAAVAPTPQQTSTQLTLDEICSVLLRDKMWNEAVCMRYSFRAEEFAFVVDQFKLHCLCISNVPTEMSDAKRYFYFWLGKFHQKLKDQLKTNISSHDAQATDYTFDGGFDSVDK